MSTHIFNMDNTDPKKAERELIDNIKKTLGTDITNTNSKNEERDLVENIKKILITEKGLINCELSELQYIKPIEKSIYQITKEEKQQRKKKYVASEKIICDLCGKEYRKSNKSYHDKTSFHLTYKHVNDKFKQLMLK